MSERSTGQGGNQSESQAPPIPEPFFAKRDLRFIIGLATSERRSAIAALIGQNVANLPPPRGYTSLELEVAVRRHVADLTELEIQNKVRINNPLIRATTLLSNLGLTVAGVDDEGQPTVRISDDYATQQKYNAVLGHILEFVLDNPDIPLQSLIGDSFREDFIRNRCNLLRAIVNEYEITNGTIRIKLEDLARLAGVSDKNQMTRHITALSKQLELVSYRETEGYSLADPNLDIESVALHGRYVTIAKNAYQTLRMIGARGEDYISAADIVQESQNTTNALPFDSSGNINGNVITALQQLTQMGLVKYIPRYTVTVSPEQYKKLKQLVTILEEASSDKPSETFINEGIKKLTAISNNSQSMRELFIELGGKEYAAQAEVNNSILQIVLEHPGISSEMVGAILARRAKQPNSSVHMRNYSPSTVRRIFLRRLHASGQLVRSVSSDDPRTFTWHIGPTIQAAEESVNLQPEPIHPDESPPSPVQPIAPEAVPQEVLEDAEAWREALANPKDGYVLLGVYTEKPPPAPIPLYNTSTETDMINQANLRAYRDRTINYISPLTIAYGTKDDVINNLTQKGFLTIKELARLARVIEDVENLPDIGIIESEGPLEEDYGSFRKFVVLIPNRCEVFLLDDGKVAVRLIGKTLPNTTGNHIIGLVDAIAGEGSALRLRKEIK